MRHVYWVARTIGTIAIGGAIGAIGTISYAAWRVTHPHLDDSMFWE